MNQLKTKLLAILFPALKNYSLGINKFEEFNLFDDFRKFTKEIQFLNNEEELLNSIETYWLDKYLGFDTPILNSMVNNLIENPNIEIQHLAKTHAISRQQIANLFKQNLGKTPTEFKKIQRFRNALQHYTKTGTSKNKLTSLSYDALFYDQSHLIKEFYNYTLKQPKTFFKNNYSLVNGFINWGKL